MEKKIGFIGTGNMASAMIRGIVAGFEGIENRLFVSNRNIDKARKISENLGVQLCQSNIDLVKKADIIILGVKPHMYKVVLEEIKDTLTKDHIFVSIAAGISIDYIQSFFKEPMKIVRTMPNTPAFVGEGMTAITLNDQVDEKELQIVLRLFESIGKADVIDEDLMDMIPAVSGSSPAYVYVFIEALADGAVLQGMDRQKAYKYAAQAVLGAAKMVLESGKHPGELKDQVCSPAGTTIEAIYSLEQNSFRGTVIEAMEACTERTREMTKNKGM